MSGRAVANASEARPGLPEPRGLLSHLRDPGVGASVARLQLAPPTLAGVLPAILSQDLADTLLFGLGSRLPSYIRRVQAAPVREVVA